MQIDGSVTCSYQSALLDGVEKRDTEPGAAVPVPDSEAVQGALADVDGILAGHGPGVGDE